METSSLKFKAVILSICFILFMVITVGTTLYITYTQSADARLIEIAGRQSVLTQKIAKEVFSMIVQSGNKEFMEAQKKRLHVTASFFDKSLKSLINGGTVIGSDEMEITLPDSKGVIRKQLEKIEGLWGPFKKNIEIVTNMRSNTNEFNRAQNYIIGNNLSLLNESNRAVALLKEASERKTLFLKNTLITTLFFTVILSVVVWFLNNKLLVNPIIQTAVIMDRMAEKDFTQFLTVKDKGEIGRMSMAVNNVVKTLGGLLNFLIDLSGTLNLVSEKMSSSAVQISNGTEKQSQKATQVSVASHEMSTSIVSVANNANEAAEAAREANISATKGRGIVKQSIDSINSIAGITRETSGLIAMLDSRSQDVGKIIQVIDDIAEQTNLLALNAAIEAARAGEHGRGFSIVADEVRKLAEKTTQATSEIAGTVKVIQDNTQKALNSMEAEVKAVDEGVKFATDADIALKEIVGQVEMVSSMIVQIASASEEQSAAAEQISSDMEEVANITKEASVEAQQIVHTGRDLTEVTSNLKETVSKFRIFNESDEAGTGKDCHEEITLKRVAVAKQ